MSLFTNFFSWVGNLFKGGNPDGSSQVPKDHWTKVPLTEIAKRHRHYKALYNQMLDKEEKLGRMEEVIMRKVPFVRKHSSSFEKLKMGIVEIREEKKGIATNKVLYKKLSKLWRHLTYSKELSANMAEIEKLLPKGLDQITNDPFKLAEQVDKLNDVIVAIEGPMTDGPFIDDFKDPVYDDSMESEIEEEMLSVYQTKTPDSYKNFDSIETENNLDVDFN